MAGHDKINWLNELASPPASGHGLGSIFGVPQPTGLAALFATPPASPPPPNLLEMLINAASSDGSCRTRASWNERFTHWERAESVTETGTIERARTNVSAAIANNGWLTGQRVEIEGQGSYFNRTNVRRDADIDLRAVHPLLKIDYDENVHIPSARQILSYSDAGLSFEQIFNGLRTNLVKELAARFGRSNVEIGKKAIRIKGITGSRAEVDVVPSIRYHHITWLPGIGQYRTWEGVAILSTEGHWTLNFPDYHAANGRAKRARTGHQFKRVVRIFKRMQADMILRGLLTAKVPSFLIECLVHAVDDFHFLLLVDDRYGRVQRIAREIQRLLSDPKTAAGLHEINEIKWLFHETQGWTHRDALDFANAAVAYLGDA